MPDDDKTANAFDPTAANEALRVYADRAADLMASERFETLPLAQQKTTRFLASLSQRPKQADAPYKDALAPKALSIEDCAPLDYTGDLSALTVDVASLDPMAIWRMILPGTDKSAEAEGILAGVLGARLRPLCTDTADRELLDRSLGRDGVAWLLFAKRVGDLALQNLPRGPGFRSTVRSFTGSCCWMAAQCQSRWALLPLVRELAWEQADCGESRVAYGLLQRVADGLARGFTPGEVVRQTGVVDWVLAELEGEREFPFATEDAPKPKKDRSGFKRPFGSPKPIAEVATDPRDEPPSTRVNVIRGALPMLSRPHGEAARFHDITEALQSIHLCPLPCPDAFGDMLLSEFPWCPDAVNALREDLLPSERVGARGFRLPPTILVGPSGAGKSRLGRRYRARRRGRPHDAECGG